MQTIPAVRTILLLVPVAGLTFGCGNNTTTTEPFNPEPPPRPTLITVSPDTVRLDSLGATAQLTAQVLDQNGQAMSDATVSWSSSSVVATVNSSGRVTAAAVGTATITATAASVSGSAWIEVPNYMVSMDVREAAPLTAIGETRGLLVTGHWADGSQRIIDNETLEWQSSDPAVATVVDGAVVAAGGGHATVRATYEEQIAEVTISVHISLRQTKTVRVLYAAPADREFRNDYRERIQYAVVDLQSWYRQQLDGLTFSLYDATPELCRMSENHDFYARGDAWNKVLEAVRRCESGASVAFWWKHLEEPDFVFVIYADLEEPCDEPNELGRAQPGHTILHYGDLDGLTNPGEYSRCGGGPWPGPLGRWIGGLGHELGHTLHLPHPPGCDEGLPTCDSDGLMFLGYTSYPATYLRAAEKEMLRGLTNFIRSN